MTFVYPLVMHLNMSVWEVSLCISDESWIGGSPKSEITKD
jgi:hypothetical protein